MGATVLNALERSRLVLAAPRDGSAYSLDVEFDYDLHDSKKIVERYESWKQDLMVRYGYKTAKSLFKNMKNCSIEKVDGEIKISPSRHEKLEAWARTKDDGIEDVVIPVVSSPREIGQALRTAFSRCIE